MTSGGNNQPNLAECEASDLALYLLGHRFSVSLDCAHAMGPAVTFDRWRDIHIFLSRASYPDELVGSSPPCSIQISQSHVAVPFLLLISCVVILTSQGDAMEATQWLLECTQCLPGAEEISAKIMGGDDDDDDDVEVVEVEAVAAVSRDDDDDDDDDETADNKVKAKKEPAAASAAADGKVSSGKVLELPKSMVDETKKEKGSPSLNHSSSASPVPVAPRTSVEVSASTPRSKFDLTLHESTGIVLRNKKEEVVAVPSSAVASVIVFPKAEDCRKATSNSRKKGPPKRPGNLVLLTLKKGEADDVQFRGKSLKQICFQLPQSILPKSSADDDEDSDGGGGMMVVEPIKERDIELEWVDLLGKTFGLSSEKVILVSNPAYLTDDGREERAYVGRYSFKSDETQGTSTTTAGMPYVKCYEGVNDGVLFPLEEGLLFFKPPKFVPRSSLHSLQCGRGGGDSRYVDLIGELIDDEGSVEFSNIAREELRVLDHYIHQVLIKAMERDVKGGGDEGGMKIEADAVASPASKFGGDERKMGPSADESPIGASSGDDSVEIVSVTGGRSRRAASREAREATKAQLQAKALAGGNDDEDSDDDDEEDFVMHDESAEDDSEEDESDASDDDEEADATESEDDDDDNDDDEEEEEPMKKKAKMPLLD